MSDGNSVTEPGTTGSRAEGEPTEEEADDPTVSPGEEPEPTGSAPTPGAVDVDVDELLGPERKLGSQVRYVWLLQTLISAVVFGLLTGVPALLVFDQLLVGPAVFAFFLLVGGALAFLRYRRWSYEVREDSLFLERGVVTQTRTVVPYVRIQHVDASRGPVERAFGLATAVVYTAGSRGADVSIPGLTPERADDLQDRLKRLAIAAEGEDAV
jgi:membrane protein YdbS with pleckstrin-like domain